MSPTEDQNLEELEDLEILDSGDPGPHYAKESSFAVPEEIHHKVKGRPRKDGAPPGSTMPDRPLNIPSPRFREYKSDATDPNRRSKPFLAYWNGLPTWAKERMECYVYREHPVLLEPPEDAETGKPKFYKYIDKISGSEPLQDELDLLHRYGCGSYKLSIQDTSTAKKPGDKGAAYCYIVNMGGGDYKSNPPVDQRINDIDQLDLDHPANKSYVAFLRGQGKLPEQLNARQQESEMANVQLIDKLTDNLLATSKEKSKDTGVLQEAMKGAMDVMQKGAEAAIQTTREANQYAAKLRDDADAKRIVAPTPTGDPMVLALEIVKLIRDERNPASNAATDARYEALQSQLSRMQESQIDSLREQVKVLMEAKVTTPAASTSPFAAMKEGLESLEQFNGVMERLKGSVEKEESVAEAVGDVAPKWLRPFLPLAPLAGQVLAAFLQSHQQTQQMPYMPPGYPSGPMPGFIPPQQINAPQMHMPQPQPQPTVAIDNPNNLPGPALEVLSSIKDSLAFHMDYEMSGSEFAGWYARQFGEPKYREISGLGTDNIMQLLTLYPPTARVIQGQKPEYVTDFVSEFCHPNLEGDGNEEDGGIKQPSA